MSEPGSNLNPGQQGMPGGAIDPTDNVMSQGGGPNFDPGADVEGAQPHMQPGTEQGAVEPTDLSGHNLNPGSTVEGAQPHMHMDGGTIGRNLGLLLVALLLGFGFLFFGPPQTVMGFFNGLGGGHLCLGPGGDAAVGNGNLAPAVLVETAPGNPDQPGAIAPGNPDQPGASAPGNPDQPGGDAAVGNGNLLTGLVMLNNNVRMALGQGLLVPPFKCGGQQTMSAPLGGFSATVTPTPTVTEEATIPIPSGGVCDSFCSSDADCHRGFVCLPVGRCWKKACDATAVPTLVPSVPPPADTGGDRKKGSSGKGGGPCPGGGTHC